MPLVVVESALKGVPVLSTNVGGVSEFVRDNLTGWLVDQDMEQISLKISQLAHDFESIKKIGINAKNLAEQNFSVEKYLLEHVNLYKELLQ